MDLTAVEGDPFAGLGLIPVEGDPFANPAAANPSYGMAQPPLGQPGSAPLDDFMPAPIQAAAPQPVPTGLAGVAGDPSRSMAVRVPAAIGSSLADQAMGLARSAWGAATLPGDVATGKVDPNSAEAIGRSTDLAGMLTLPAALGEANPNIARVGLTPVAGNPFAAAGLKTKIVDEGGNPRTVYHGTTSDFTDFDESARGTNTGASGAEKAFFFAGNPDDTHLYTEMAQERAEKAYLPIPSRRTIAAHVRSDNPLILTPWEEANVAPDIVEQYIDNDPGALDYAESNGYDSVVWPHGNMNNSAYTIAVFDRNRIHQLPDRE